MSLSPSAMRPILKHNINEDDSDEDSGDGISGAKRLKISSALRDGILDSPLDITTEYEARLGFHLYMFEKMPGKDFVISCQGWQWFLHIRALEFHCANIGTILQGESFPIAERLNDHAKSMFKPITKVTGLEVSGLAPVVVDMVVDYWYTQRTDIRNSAQINFGTPAAQHADLEHEDAENHSPVTEFQQYYEMAILAQKFGDERLYDIAITKFRIHLRSLCKTSELVDAIKAFYHESYDDKHDIQAFRDIIALAAWQRKVHYVGHSMTNDLSVWVLAGNRRFIECLERMGKADTAVKNGQGKRTAGVRFASTMPTL